MLGNRNMTDEKFQAVVLDEIAGLKVRGPRGRFGHNELQPSHGLNQFQADARRWCSCRPQHSMLPTQSPGLQDCAKPMLAPTLLCVRAALPCLADCAGGGAGGAGGRRR